MITCHTCYTSTRSLNFKINYHVPTKVSRNFYILFECSETADFKKFWFLLEYDPFKPSIYSCNTDNCKLLKRWSQYQLMDQIPLTTWILPSLILTIFQNRLNCSARSQFPPSWSRRFFSAYLALFHLYLRPCTRAPFLSSFFQPVLCPRTTLLSPPRLRGLGELIVRVVYVTPEPSGRVEYTSSIVTYPHRRRAAVHRTEAVVLSHLSSTYLNLRSHLAG